MKNKFASPPPPSLSIAPFICLWYTYIFLFFFWSIFCFCCRRPFLLAPHRLLFLFRLLLLLLLLLLFSSTYISARLALRKTKKMKKNLLAVCSRRKKKFMNYQVSFFLSNLPDPPPPPPPFWCPWGCHRFFIDFCFGCVVIFFPLIVCSPHPPSLSFTHSLYWSSRPPSCSQRNVIPFAIVVCFFFFSSF